MASGSQGGGGGRGKQAETVRARESRERGKFTKEIKRERENDRIPGKEEEGKRKESRVAAHEKTRTAAEGGEGKRWTRRDRGVTIVVQCVNCKADQLDQW